MEVLVEKLIDFIKRAFLPSFVFYTFLYVLNISYWNEKILSALNKKVLDNIDKMDDLFYILLIFFIGTSYILSFLQQILIDNNFKKNFETFCILVDENTLLRELRQKVKNKMNKDNKYSNLRDILQEANDYILYRILSQGENISGTKNYIDDVKTYGILIISFGLSLLWNYYFSSKVVYLIGLLVFIIIFFIFLKDFILSRYRTRNIRLYIHYLKQTN